LALSGAIAITVKKIFSPIKQAYTYNGTGKDIAIVTANLKTVTPIADANGTTGDSLYEMVDGTLLWGVESFSDSISELSAADRTGS
jgi:hypothetical protein